jgi:hypothetical protein
MGKQDEAEKYPVYPVHPVVISLDRPLVQTGDTKDTKPPAGLDQADRKNRTARAVPLEQKRQPLPHDFVGDSKIVAPRKEADRHTTHKTCRGEGTLVPIELVSMEAGLCTTHARPCSAKARSPPR